MFLVGALYVRLSSLTFSVRYQADHLPMVGPTYTVF